MSSTGSVFSSMFNVSGSWKDVLEVWDGSKYLGVAEALNGLAGLPDHIEANEARIQALEDKAESLDQDKAQTFIDVPPLFLKTDVCPPPRKNRLTTRRHIVHHRIKFPRS